MSGTLSTSSIPLRLSPYFRIADAVSIAPPHLRVSHSSRRTAGERQHAAENAAADLERLLKLLEVLDSTAGSSVLVRKIFLQLLHERKHRAKRVVDVVRHAAREIRHRVFPLGDDDARCEATPCDAGSEWRWRPGIESARPSPRRVA